MELNSTIDEIKGIGTKTQSLFNKLHIYTVYDLLMHFPNRYESFDEPTSTMDISPVMAIKGELVRTESFRRKRIITNAYFKDDLGGVFVATWFNMPYRSKLDKNEFYIVRGRTNVKAGRLYLEQPNIYSISEYEKLRQCLSPNYPKTLGLNNNQIIKAIKNAILIADDLNKYDKIPSGIRNKYGLIDMKRAILGIHFPENIRELELAKKTIIFHEFFNFLFVARLNNKAVNRNFYKMDKTSIADSLISKLPFSLTLSQIKVYNEIKKNMSGTKLMNRLVQGDVGSGKTIIAILSILICLENGYQASLMAPTQVLAKQHYTYISKLFSENKYDYNVAILTSDVKNKEKKIIYEKIKNGEHDLVIGTSALIQEGIEFKNLALVITDEQHRFGVKQRKELLNKGTLPHRIVMSATPIPRTLAVILYSGMNISIINELPSGRLPIKNYVVDESYRDRIYKFMLENISEGRQVYIICPLAIDSEVSDGENVVEYSENLSLRLGDKTRIGYLHGKMSSSEKDEIINSFYENRLDILVSTTVIEVGINVPNATIMLIENADRFGLAGLHQLRGRIGRGDKQSYCIFMTNNRSKKSIERLQILKNSNDGFYIASEDMKLRGFGELVGLRQSGRINFRLADIYMNADVLKEAGEAIDELFTNEDISVINGLEERYSKEFEIFNVL